MTEQQKVHCYARVDRPYESVRDVLHRLQLASGAVAPVHIHSICDQRHVAGLPSVTRVTLGWEATDAPTSTPVSSAEIYASALSPSETQLEIEGHCHPPPRAGADASGGPAADSAAEKCILTLLESLIQQLRHDIDP